MLKAFYPRICCVLQQAGFQKTHAAFLLAFLPSPCSGIVGTHPDSLSWKASCGPKLLQTSWVLFIRTGGALCLPYTVSQHQGSPAPCCFRVQSSVRIAGGGCWCPENP